MPQASSVTDSTAARRGARRWTGLVSFALAIAFLSSVTSISPGATGSSPATRSAAARAASFALPPTTLYSPYGPYLDGSVLVGFHSGVSAGQRHAIENGAGALGARRIGPVIKPAGRGRVTGAEYLAPFALRVPDGRVFSAVARLRRDRDVAYAEPNYLSRTSATEPPNDPFFSKQWGDENTGQKIPFQNGNEELGAEEAGTPGADDHALAAWNALEASGKPVGSRSIVIGEVDTGVAYNHPDLKANIWSNPGGIGENGKKEKCAAKTHGYDVVNQVCNPLDEDTSYGGHGSHVAGIMGAVGNNEAGVAGMNWETTILPVRWVKNAGDKNPTSMLSEALRWLVKAKQEGVNIRVVNDSDVFEGTEPSTELKNAIELLGANGILFVTAAGNTSANNDEASVKRYPCKYDLPTEICVTASTNKDALAGFANYGPKTVDLAAPGQSIYSTLRANNYGYLSGGSMASPQVAGAAALILSVKPSYSPTELKADILEHVDKVPSLEGKIITGGRLDVCKAMPGCSLAIQPIVATNPASSITQTSATLNGTVNPEGPAVSDCHFEYGSSQSYGTSVPCASLPGAGESSVEVSAIVGSLSPNSTYHFRIVATNPGGTSRGNDQTLTTLPDPPTVVTEQASSVTQTSATLNATVNPGGATVQDCHFEYGSSPAYGTSVPCASLPGAGNSAVPVSASVVGLSEKTTYHVRIVATNSGGASQGEDQELITPRQPVPIVATNPASSITQTSATLNGTVNPEGPAVSDCHFEYGSSPSYGTSVPCASLPGAGESSVEVSAIVGSLSPNSTYHFRIVATNPGGTSRGNDQTLTTLPDPPTVVTEQASSVTQTSATLNATVNPGGATVQDCHFEYGSSPAYGTSVPCASLPGAANSAVPVSAMAGGLNAGVGYYYRIVATNTGGTSYGAAQGFTTQPATPPLVQQAPGGQLPSSGQGVLATQEHEPPPVASAQLASRALVVTSSGTVSVEVICSAGEGGCAGTVTIWTLSTLSAHATGHQPKKRRTVVLTLARRSFAVLGGRVSTVRMRLSVKARALLARTNRLHVHATLVTRDPTGTTHTANLAVTLRLASAIRHPDVLGRAQRRPGPR